ncbi:MAG: hypothetical protein K2X86_00720 [Cytophagaceae bacterium]|nr:hypothetical protein [Cytophagaceae bacterium]
MKKLKIEIGEILQGDFSFKKLNLLLVFQVNCPGCFLHAMPSAGKVYLDNMYKGLNVLGLSTAFEDFDLNTKENTIALLKHKTLTGETKKSMKEYGYNEFPFTIPFPVAMDKLMEAGDFITEENIEHLCNTIPAYKTLHEQEKEILQFQIKQHFRESEKTSYTFSINQMKGTPTWVLFNEDLEILAQWFGHQPVEKMEENIKQHLQL